jgi:hypothetical protein
MKVNGLKPGEEALNLFSMPELSIWPELPDYPAPRITAPKTNPECQPESWVEGPDTTPIVLAFSTDLVWDVHTHRLCEPLVDFYGYDAWGVNL